MTFPEYYKTFSVAPMMALTDRHFRFLLRLVSKQARLYTEMVVWNSIVYGDRARFLDYDEAEHPVILQLGGGEPEHLRRAIDVVKDWQYDEVNLNVGCPSDRVKKGAFGASLMAYPDLVADCVDAMRQHIDVPVTVKSRIGVDDRDSYDQLVEFIGKIADKGCEHFIVHARKAWLKGLNPKQNRSIPPLKYDVVYRLKQNFPALEFTINGGITDLEQCKMHWGYVDGVMLGRAAYDNPWLLHEIDAVLDRENGTATDRSEPQIISNTLDARVSVIHEYLNYVEAQLSKDIYLRHMSIHMLNFFHGQPGAKNWRRYLSQHAVKKDAGIHVIEQALKFIGTTAPYEAVA